MPNKSESSEEAEGNRSPDNERDEEKRVSIEPGVLNTLKEVGLVIGTALLTGYFALRSKRVDKEIANGVAKTVAYQTEVNREEALIDDLEKRIDQLNSRVQFLETMHHEEEVRRDEQEKRLRAAEASRDANAARIQLLEIIVEQQKEQIAGLKEDNRKLAERLQCSIHNCPFIKPEAAKEVTS